MNKILIAQLLVIVSVIIVLINTVLTIKSNKKEKRISEYSLSKKDFNNKTIIEKISNINWKLVHILSKLLCKSKYLVKKSIPYEKYILIKEENYKSPIDYISVRFITIILFIIIYLLLVLVSILPFNWLILVLFFCFGFIIPDFIWDMLYIKKCELISKKLYETIIIIQNNLIETNIYNAITKVIDSSEDEIADEYSKVLTDLSYNISIYQAFKRFYERTKIPEIKIIYHILNIENDNLELAFERIRNEFDYIDKINNNKNLIYDILSVLKTLFMIIPIVLVIIMAIINPTYLKTMLDSSIGVVILEITIIVYILLVFTIKYIVEDRK